MLIKLKDFHYQYSDDQSTLRFEQTKQINQYTDCVLMTNHSEVLSILQLIYHHDPERINYYSAHYVSTNFMKEIMEFSGDSFLNLNNNTAKPPVFLGSASVVNDMNYHAATDYSPVGFLSFTNLHDRYVLVDHALSKQGIMSVKDVDNDTNELIFQRASLAVKPLIFRTNWALNQYPAINFNGIKLSIRPYHNIKSREFTNTKAVTRYLKYDLRNSLTIDDTKRFSKLINHTIIYSNYPKVVSKHFDDRFDQFLESKLVFLPAAANAKEISVPSNQCMMNVNQLLASQDCEVV